MKDSIKKIIIEWQQRQIEPLFNRSYALAYSEEIDVVVGLRRSGKSYLIYSEIEKLKQNDIDQSQILYINFDDERLAELTNKNMGLILETYFELYPENVNNQVYLFFDEIQNIKGWHLFVKRLYELKKYKIIITGSSSKFLSTDIATELRGRTLTTKFFPLSFKEFLNFKNIKISKNIEFSQDRFQVIKLADEYLHYGGYPRVTLEKSENGKNEILKDYLDMIIFRDLIERYDIRNIHILKLIINYVLSNFASEFSVNNFFKKFKKEYSLNKVTVFNYFSYIEEAGFLYYLQSFSYKIHERFVTKKNYIADNGFIRLLSFRGMEITGRLLENLIFMELIKRKKIIFYFKNVQHHECDFIISENDRIIQAIQVCHKLTRENRERELRGIIAAMTQFKLETGIIITSDQEETIISDNNNISVIPAWKWLIS